MQFSFTIKIIVRVRREYMIPCGYIDISYKEIYVPSLFNIG